MSRIAPESWMPDCQMHRVITHWTAGEYYATPVDREHYHLLIEGDGRLVRGDHSILDNLTTADDNYAAHTYRKNAGSIGVAVCCMAGAMQRPFRPGSHAMRPEQYEALAVVASDLCERYGIPVTEQTVLGHGEVERALGVPQRGKWDPMVLPWDPDPQRSFRAVGDAFRDRVRAFLQSRDVPAVGGRDGRRTEQLPPVTVVVDGRVVTDEGILKGGASWTPLRPLAEALGWTILHIDARSARIQTPAGLRDLDAAIRGDRGYVRVRDVVAALGWATPEWDGTARAVRLQSA